MLLVEGDIEAEVRQAFTNLEAVCEAAGGSLNHLAKVNVFLTNLDHFPVVNQVMDEFFEAPFPARAAIGVAALPKGARLKSMASWSGKQQSPKSDVVVRAS